MDTDMDSLHLYEEVSNRESLKTLKAANTTIIGSQQRYTPSLEDLDPTLELTVDLQGLIQQATEQATTPDLYPDLLPGENHHPPAQPAHLTELQTVDSVFLSGKGAITPYLLTPDDSGDDTTQMPHAQWLQDYVVVKPDPDSVQPPTTIDLHALLQSSNSQLLYQQHSPTGVTIAEATSSSPLGSPGAARPSSALSPVGHADYSFTAPLSPARTSYKAAPPGKTRGRKQPDKASGEYRDRRERNNVAVRKSRDKAKLRQIDTEEKVKGLVSDNDRLQKKCDLLSKELTVLKGLFTNVGAAMPEEFKRQFEMLARK